MRAMEGEGVVIGERSMQATSWEIELSPERPFGVRVAEDARPGGYHLSIHDGLEVGVLLSGEVEIWFGEHEFHAGVGDVWLVSMWEPHRWRVALPDTRQVTVVFRPEFIVEGMMGDHGWLELYACPAGERPMRQRPEAKGAVLAIGRELRREAEERGPGWQTAVRLSTARLLLTLGRGWRPGSGSGGVGRKGYPDLARIMPALAAVHARPARRVGVAEAAATCGLSAAQFGRVFRRLMGLSFGQFRLRSRLAFAAHLLLTTKLSTQAIAAQTGFVDGSHLHRRFVGQYGRTPRRYRTEAA